MQIPIDLLNTFVVVAETKNFTLAGKRIHKSQSAVSMQIKRLTETVGKPLIEMDGKKVRLSPMGELVLEHAKKILKTHDAAIRAINQSEMKGRVRLGAAEDYCSLFVPKILSGFARDYPDIRVDVICRPGSTLYGDLIRGDLDLAICTALKAEGEKIYQERIEWVARDKKAMLEKESLPLAVYNSDCPYRNWAIEALESINRPFHIAYMSPSISGILAAVRAGLAIAPVAQSAIEKDLLRIGPEDGFPALPTADVCLYGAEGKPNRLVESLASHVRQTFETAVTGKSGQYHCKIFTRGADCG